MPLSEVLKPKAAKFVFLDSTRIKGRRVSARNRHGDYIVPLNKFIAQNFPRRIKPKLVVNFTVVLSKIV